MEDKNVKVGPAQFAEFIERAKENLLLDMFAGYESEQMMRWRYKQALEKDTRPTYYDLEFEGPWTMAGMREWLDMIEAVSKELNIEPVLETDYDATFRASWERSIPYTPEEKERARAWLEANPEPAESKTVQWRRSIPFTVGYGTARGNEDDEPF